MSRAAQSTNGSVLRRAALLGAVSVWAFAAPAFAQSVGPSLLESQLQKIRQGQMNARTAATVMAASGTRAGGNVLPPPPELIDGRTPPINGGFIARSWGAPLTDDFNSPLGYCVRGQLGTSDTSDISLAVIFAGPDSIFDTTCDEALEGAREGDDYVATYSATTLDTAYTDTSILREETEEERDLIPLAELSAGEMLFVNDLKALFRWDSANGWENVSGLSSSSLTDGLLDANFDDLETNTLRINGLAGAASGALRTDASGNVVVGNTLWIEIDEVPTLVQSLGSLPPSQPGLLVSTGVAVGSRSIAGVTNQLVVANADGVGGNPELGLATILGSGENAGFPLQILAGSPTVSGIFGGLGESTDPVTGVVSTILNLPRVTLDVFGRVVSAENVALNLTDTLAAWRTDGNTITSTSTAADMGLAPTGQFLGTKSSSNLVIATDNKVRMVIAGDTGMVSMGLLSTNADAFINGVRVGRGGGNFLSNTTLGSGALATNGSGQANVAIGQNALQNSFSGNSNIAIGQNALQNASGVSQNIAIGANAGANVTGSDNLFLGNQAGSGATSVSNKLFIANSASNNLLYGDFATGRLAINAGAEPSLPTGTLEVNAGADSNTPALVVRGANGNTGALLLLQGHNGDYLTDVFTVNASGGLTINPTGGTNPLTLLGLPNGSTTDNILSVDDSGVVRRRNLSDVVGSFWALGGNANADADSFVGTTNAVDLVLKTNNVTRFTINGSTGAGNFAGPLTVGGGLSTTTLNTSGLATLNSLAVTGNANITGSLGVTGASTFTSATFNGLGTFNAGLTANTITVSGASALNGNTTVGGTLGVTGLATLNGGLTVTGTAGTPNVTFASLGGTAGNTVPTGFDRVLLANNAGALNQVSLTNLLAQNSWLLRGNSGTDPLLDFLGTKDAVDLAFRTTDIERFRIGADGAGTFVGTLTAGGLTTANATITGGSIDGTPIGATTASTGRFLALTVTSGGATTLGGTLGVTGLTTLNGGLTVTGTAGTPNVTIASIGGAAANAPSTGFDRFVIASNTGALRQVGIDSLLGDRAWLLGGNAVTDPDAQYLGTSNYADFVVKTNAAEVARFTADGVAQFTGQILANGGLTVSNGLTTDTLSVSGTSSFSNTATFAGTTLFAQGSAGAASIARAGDTDTGFFFPAANTLAATTSGFERLRISSGGFVGIGLGNTNPLYRLDVSAAAGADPMRLQGLRTGAVSDDLLSVDANGVVRRRNLGEITGSYWALGGNAGTDPANEYLGTSDTTNLSIRTDGTERFLIAADGAGNFYGALTVGSLVTGNAQITGGAISGTAITGGSINATPIGMGTNGAAAGRFTTLGATGAVTLNTAGSATTTIGNAFSATTIGGSLAVTGLASLNGGATVGTTGLTVAGTPGTPNVTFASLGGSVNADRANFDRVLVANNTGQVFQLDAAQLLNDNVWLTTGNANTANGGTLGSAPAVGGNFIGTTGTGVDARDLSFVTGNVIRAQISTGGVIRTQNDMVVNGVTVGRGAGTNSNNTAIGVSALASNTGGAFNTAIGSGALALNTSGTANTAIGSGALALHTTGAFNTAIGSQALTLNTTGFGNTANGANTLFANTTGFGNTAIGSDALWQNTTGIFNTAIGSNVLAGNTTGSSNTAIGDSAGRLTNAGGNLSAVSNSVFLGSDTRALAVGNTNTIVIGSGARGLGSNSAVLGNSSITATRLQGRVGIGADPTIAAGAAQLQVTAAAAANRGLTITGAASQTANLFEIQDSAGTVLASIDSTGAGSFAGLTSTAGLTVNCAGSVASPNVTISSLGGSVNADRANFNRVLVANNTGQVFQLDAAQLLNDNVWLTTGNANTANGGTLGSAPAVGGNFIGTTGTGDAARDLSFVTGNVIRAQISTAGVLSTQNDMVVNGVTVGRGGGNSAVNTAIGVSALASNTTGTNNTATGVNALWQNTTGISNTAIGSGAMRDNTTGSSNTATGMFALLQNNIGSDNTATGMEALYSNTSGAFNTATGVNALRANTTGSSNTANGVNALLDNTTGGLNTATGRNALQSNTGGGSNAAFGFRALFENTTGNRNTSVGMDSLRTAVTGSDNVALGFEAGYDETGSNKLYIANSRTANLIYGDFATGRVSINAGATPSAPGGALQVNTGADGTKGLVVRASSATQTANLFEIQDSAGAALLQVTSDGRMGIGKAPDAGYALDVQGDMNATGTVRANGVALTSDARFKTNVQAITDALAIVRRLQGVSYDWNRVAYPERGFSSRPQIGVIAQQVESVLPELVDTDAQGYKSVNYIGLVPVLIEGMKQQADRMDVQDERLGKAEKQLGLVEERLFKNEEQVVKLDERMGKAESFVARFELTAEPDTMVVLTPTFKVQNFTAERAYIAELRAQRIEADKARFKELDADDAVIDNVDAARLRGRVVNTGGKELFVSYGSVAPLFDAAAGGHYLVTVSSEDGSYATAQVINAGGTLRVVPTAGQGIDVVANGNSVGLVAPSKKVKASWTRTG